MWKPKIYLETTLFNFYLDVDRDAHTASINVLHGYRAIEILNPMEVVDNEEQ